MEQIGEYIVRRLVGEGGMGRVYEAEERLSKRRVALKVLRDELAQSEHARALFLNEMQILAHLEHRNIVRSLASLETEGKLVTVLEYLEGKTLRVVANERGRLPWEEAAYVAAEVAQALGAAHGQVPPVIHRDLKPENIMVLEDGSVKVTDFGIAKLIQELNQPNTQSVGTLQYMSPEQIDATSIDHRSDLYCLGLVLYELLAGHPPFQSGSPRVLLNLQCTEPPPPLANEVRAGLPKGVEKLLFALLAKAPADRPATATEVAERLEGFVPERSFAGLGDGAKKLAPAASPAGKTVAAEPSTGVPSGDTLVSASAEGRDTPRRASRPEGRVPSEGETRKDTVALVERVGRRRESPTAAAVAIVVGLAVASAVATYFIVRASGAPGPAASATASEPPAPTWVAPAGGPKGRRTTHATASR
ncbi:MAG: protein kinase [Myxococcales bacterium]|nr:protein kinase [Myxococcales bacterium]